MWRISFLVMAIVGFVSGSILGISLNVGFENPSLPLCLGILGAFAFTTLQMLMTCTGQVKNKFGRSQEFRPPRKPRIETEGKFTDRMERFAANVQQEAKDRVDQPKMPLWIADECNDFEPTPPKPIGIIRLLLHRIRKVLTGN